MYQQNPSQQTCFKCVKCGYDNAPYVSPPSPYPLNNYNQPQPHPFPHQTHPGLYPNVNHPNSQNIGMPMPMPTSIPTPGATPHPHSPYPVTNRNVSSTKNREPKNIPTVTSYYDFDRKSDAEILRKAMKGFGTDEKAIINVLTNRCNHQRQEIEEAFKTMYGKDLVRDLKSELSGNLEVLIVALMKPLHTFYAEEIRDAIDGLGTDEDTLIEVFCSLPNQEIHLVKQAYHEVTERSLEEDIGDDVSGSLKRLLISLSMGNRDEFNFVDDEAAYADAQKLLIAGELQLGTDESAFNEVLCQRSFAQLRLIFEKYEGISGHNIKKAIKSEFSGDIETALLSIVRCVRDRSTYFAKQFHKAMKGAGTDDKKLIRLVVTRCECDLGNIKEAYFRKYNRSLEDDIKDETSGDFKKCLISLLG